MLSLQLYSCSKSSDYTEISNKIRVECGPLIHDIAAASGFAQHFAADDWIGIDAAKDTDLRVPPMNQDPANILPPTQSEMEFVT
jgi:hypothetical protein